MADESAATADVSTPLVSSAEESPQGSLFPELPIPAAQSPQLELLADDSQELKLAANDSI
jgi:hypothetical protein